MPRQYRLGRRQPSVEATARSILDSASELVREGGPVSVSAVARKAGVSRITVYNRFGTRAALLEAVAPRADPTSPRTLERHFEAVCGRWAADPALFRNLRPSEPDAAARSLAESLAAADRLRPGVSIREAEDVIAALSSFAVFDRLHRDGRRPAPAVAEVLMRLAAGIIA